MARFRVIKGLAGEELAFDQRPIAFQVGLGELQVSLALPDRGLRHFVRGLGLVDLFLDLAILHLGDRLPSAH